MGSPASFAGSLNMLAEGANIGFRVARPDSNPGDHDGDDVVGVTDFLQMLAAWGPCQGCVEDIDNDGVVGIVDLLALLAAWGST